MTFQGFTPRTRLTPVPDPLLGTLLRDIDDLLELKCVLRALWLLHRKRGKLRTISIHELQAAPVIAGSLPASPLPSIDSIRASMDRAARRGIFIAADVSAEQNSPSVYLLNTEANRRALPELANRMSDGVDDRPPIGEEGHTLPQRPNIFRLYEDNIGMMTPLLADELRDAEATYPPSWIEEAFKLAVEGNRRSWKYVARILQRWEAEGKDSGEPGRHSSKGDRQGYLEDYLRRRNALPRR